MFMYSCGSCIVMDGGKRLGCIVMYAHECSCIIMYSCAQLCIVVEGLAVWSCMLQYVHAVMYSCV